MNPLYMRNFACRQNCAEQLRDIPSNELTELVLDILKKQKGKDIDEDYLMLFASREDDIFMGAGACDVLRERHGDEYVNNLLGFRKPVTLKEKIIYFLTRNLPKIEKQ